MSEINTQIQTLKDRVAESYPTTDEDGVIGDGTFEDMYDQLSFAYDCLETVANDAIDLATRLAEQGADK